MKELKNNLTLRVFYRHATTFLASDLAKWITGTILNVDGELKVN